VTYTRVIAELATELPALALASRTVGSPQIRNRGTVGGNLGAASPAGDSHPALLAAHAEVELSSLAGVRRVPAAEFYTGVKKHAGRPDELVTAVWVRPASGPQQFSKIGTRNAMVIAVAAFGLALHPDRQTVGTGIGSAGPTPLRAREAEDFLAGELDWEGRREVPESVAGEFARLVAAAASPIDDVRGTAAYRRHALGVMARRCLSWAWTEHRTGHPGGED
jgi:CO/xanthine dehydrogenase FAD-binding subunit